MKKKILFFTAAMLLCVSGWAQSGTCGTNLTWTLSEGTLTISGTGAMANYGQYWSNDLGFYTSAPWDTYRSQITNVEIGDGVTSIGNNAFYHCSNLTILNIPNSVTTIGNQAFSGCYGLSGTLTIPNGVTAIGDYTFSGCSGLSGALTIPDNVKTIGTGAFQYCSGLTSVTIPNSVTSIVSAIFADCSSLVSITIPNTVTSIGNSAFSGCSSLTSITIPQSVTSIGNSAFGNCSELAELTNINAVDTIGDYAFDGTKWLANQPDGVIYIGNLLYKYKGTMPDNTDIIVRDGTVSIAPRAFYDCRKLKSIDFPNSLVSIGSRAFSYCMGLTSITIGESVTSIGYGAFAYCFALKTVNFNAVNCKMVYYYNSSYDEYVFNNCNALKTLNIGNNVQKIPAYAFYNRSSLETVNFSNSVTTIESRAFYGCTGLAALNLPNSVQAIEFDAFSGCSNLTSVTIPNSVTSIGNSAFSDCSSLQTVNFNATNCTQMSSSSSTSVFKSCTSLTTLNIGDNVQNIPNYAFYSCNGLTSVTIPTSVTNIGSSAFSGCSGLNSIIINSTAPIGNSAFYGCSSVKSIKITNNITSIGSNAFYNCKPIDVIIPDISSVYTPILTDALRKLTLTNSTSLSSTAFNSVTANLQELYLPNTLTSIASGSFSKFINLTDLTLPFIGTSPTNPTTLNTLGANSNTLKKLTISRYSTNVEIAANALSGYAKLEELTIGTSVSGVGADALKGCYNLKDIYVYSAAAPVAYEGISESVYALCVLHVPVGRRDHYSTRLGWKEFLNSGGIEEEAEFTLTVRPVPLYGGIIEGALQYNYDDNARLTASGNMGYDFQAWMEGESIVSTTREYNFTVDGARTLYAVFTPRENENEVEITTTPTEAVIVWNGEAGASSYTLIIYSDAARTQEYARFEYDANGNLRAARAANPQIAANLMSCTVDNLTANQKYYYSLTSYDTENYKLNIAIGDFTATETNSGVAETYRDTFLPVAYYNILGQKMPKEPEHGLYIILYDNGKTEKVLK
ncbi:MAG: leucine-rich repeat domain-containing protein [Prevotellaceae bacterium]|jgi:hypothetical protein|nr:leucine-rich repeat domain-containing protein [Prevotellaceae bacterium]